eukprot:m.346045 g.346045  ORF g.346045 m.346045 type:complete len:188 (+) comp28035_c0_seq1:234-797(+)
MSLDLDEVTSPGAIRRRNSINRGQGKFNREEHLDLKACFEIYDTDSDGKLSSDDAIKCLRALGNVLTEAEVTEIVVNLDIECEGICDYNNLIKLHEQYKKPPIKNADLVAAFKALDEDGSGDITSQELRRVLQILGEPLSDSEVDEFMKAADANGDGTVDFKEFSDMMIKPTRRRMSLFGDPRKRTR